MESVAYLVLPYTPTDILVQPEIVTQLVKCTR